MPEFDNRGQVSLWKSKSDNPKAPSAKGTVVAHRDIREGEELDIALWREHSDNPKAPIMKGKISDKFQPTGGQEWSRAAPQADAGRFDDEIPFDLIRGPLT